MRKATGSLVLEEVMTRGFIYWSGRVSAKKVVTKPTSANTMLCLGYLEPVKAWCKPLPPGSLP